MESKIQVASVDEAQEICDLINKAFEIEDGDSGIAFKNRPRLWDPFDQDMRDRYDQG